MSQKERTLIILDADILSCNKQIKTWHWAHPLTVSLNDLYHSMPWETDEAILLSMMRRADFLPVGEESEGEVLERGYHSLSDDDSEGEGLELALGNDAFAEYEDAEVGNALGGAGIIAADFE